MRIGEIRFEFNFANIVNNFLVITRKLCKSKLWKITNKHKILCNNYKYNNSIIIPIRSILKDNKKWKNSIYVRIWLWISIQ